MIDGLLASLHHLLAFGLVGLLMAEWALLRGSASAEVIARLARIDLAYGIVAGVLLVVGVLRVLYGVKGATFYTGSWVFWLKMAAFLAAGLISIRPTLAFIGWARGMKQGGDLPKPADWLAMRGIVVIELHLLSVAMVAAALVARGVGH